MAFLLFYTFFIIDIRENQSAYLVQQKANFVLYCIIFVSIITTFGGLVVFAGTK